MRRSHATPADLAACRVLLRGGSKSFHLAARFLPRPTCDAAIALYAFCRLADDRIDAQEGGEAALAELHERLRLAAAGTPAPIAADRALADILPRYAIPLALPEALLEGFAWDAARRQYETESDVLAYAVRVAGTVGAMMALLMQTRDAAALARAVDLGVAMQLSNIARDVGEDARAGRLYLPRAWMREAGLDPEMWLARPEFSPALATVVGRVLARAEALYARAEAGIAMLPRGCRAGIRSARALYREIGREVARNGGDSVTRRAVVPTGAKLRVLAEAMTARQAARDDQISVMPEAAFLLDAVRAHPLPHEPHPRAGLDARVAWVIGLFADLHRMHATTQ
ncbi:MAG: phytoene/squalene synthase family protein [Acetobacteraceae bacterium]|nr:phytoene/squalene synthase family protein [Acetobacteraceae bacterium]